MNMNKTCSEIIAEWIVDLNAEDIPAVTRVSVEDTIIDTVALAIAALDTDYGIAVRKAHDSPGQCTVWGLECGTGPLCAAIINGTCAHGEDFDNTYEGCPVHTGVVMVPALFAAGQSLNLTHQDVFKGIVVGVEIANRLGAVAGKGVHSAGFHPTSILGTIGAAAGVAAAMRQTKDEIRNTLGIAGSMSSGIIEYLADGSWTKRVHAGWAAHSGIISARMGAAGFRGPSTVIEGTHGLYSSFSPSINPDYDPLVSDLGSTWHASRVAFKPYACGTMTQPYIDCAIRLRSSGVVPGDIARISCEVGEGTVHRLWEPMEIKREPPTAYAAKFSSPYTIAAGLVFGDAGLAQFTKEAVNDPRIQNLTKKISYVIDPDNEYPRNYTGHVRVELNDGTILEERQAQLRGGIADPLGSRDIINKARANLEFSGRDPDSARELESFARSLFKCPKQFNDTLLARLGK